MLNVIEVKGRFPTRPKPLRPEHIEVLVTEREPGVFVIRLDHTGGCDDFWLQLRVSVEPKEGVPCRTVS
jgi:hypothetical protein